jgi:hypothetical protein
MTGESFLQWTKNVVSNIVFQKLCVWTSTKPILKGFFINCIHNNITQKIKNKIVNYI